MLSLKVRAIGSSCGVILPKEALQHLHLKEGDEVFLVETPDGYEMRPYDSEFHRQMEIAEKVMKRYKNALRELSDC